MAQITHGKEISKTRIARGHKNATRRAYGNARYGATLRNYRMAPNKIRLVLDLIRGKPVEEARNILKFSDKRAAYLIDRLVLSALGNADVKSQGRVGSEEMFVAEAFCDEGARMRRWKAGPMGRSRPIIRRSCHITVVLGEKLAN